MWENILIWAIIGGCAVYTGRRLYNQWRKVIDPKASISCDCGCSGCSTTNCEERK